MKKILLFCLLFSFFVFSQNFEYKVYDPVIPGVAKINVDNTIELREEIEQNHIICKGNTTDIDLLIDREVTYKDSELSTLCYFDAGSHNTLNCWELGYGPGGGGYWKRSSPNSGTSVIISQDTKTEISSGLQGAFQYNSLNPIYENTLKTISYARLSKFNLFQEGNDINAEGRVGVGCLGTYNYKVEGPGTSKTFTGNLDNIKANYKFDKIGNYKITFTTSVNNCLVVYEEKYKDQSGKIQKLIHRYIESTKQTTRTTNKILNVQVVDEDGPTYTQPEGNVNCGLTYTGGIIFLPPRLVEGQSVIIPAYMRITNSYDTTIYVKKITTNFYDSGFIIIGQGPTDDIEINSMVTEPQIISGGIFKQSLEIPPGETRRVDIYINATVVNEEPAESYNLRMNFDYSYPTPEHGCYEAGSGTGSCPASINVNVIDTPDDVSVSTYSLNSNVIIEPNLINKKFIDDGKDTVRIHGRVNFTNSTTTGTPPVTTSVTSFPNGAMVRLIGLEAGGNSCLSGYITPVYTIDGGNYEFKDVKLKEECRKIEMFEILTAIIVVRYSGIQNSSTGTGLINTLIDPLKCEITYSMIGSNYNPEGGEEEYNVTVSIWDGLDLQKIEYSCGIEDKNTGNLNGEEDEDYSFVCTYDFTEGDETEYIVTATVYDTDERTNYIVQCPARNIGLCLPYV